MIDRILRLYKKESFQPSILGFLINPFYFVRRSIYQAVKRHANEIRGKVLDFGCGSKPYEHLFQVEEYVGIDVHQVGHDHAKEPVDVFLTEKISLLATRFLTVVLAPKCSSTSLISIIH